MTKTKSTKRALLTSGLALLLCLSMFVGTTFAWFTDSVSSLNNKIVAGNLDVDLEYWDGDSWETVTAAGNLFTGELWEPGHTEVIYLKVVNEGTLALKYQLGVNIVSETEGTNVDNETFKLSDYIEFGVVEGNVNYGTDRNAARTAVTDAKIISAGYAKSSELYPAGEGTSEEYVAMVVYMPEETGNEANYRGDDIPTIELGVNLLATQLQAENDSFGNDYDKDAKYLISANEEVVLNGNKFVNAVENFGEATLNNVVINANGDNALYNEGTVELKDVTLNMTGNTGYITNSRTDGSVTVYENVTATSSGGGVNVWQGKAVFKSGTITTNSTSTSARHMFYVADGAELVIEDGEFFFNPTNLTRKGSYICADTNATVIVKGGTFHKPSTRTAPIQELNGSTVEIYGGTFEFDPTNWVAPGYTAIKNGSTWYVVSDEFDAVASNADELIEALENGKDVLLLGDVKIDPAGMSNAYGTTGINVKNGQTIDGNGNTLDIKGAGGTWDSGINTTGGVIKNITVTGSFRGIFINHNSTHSEKVVLENVIIDGTTYTISCDQGLNQGLEATNSTFNGWTSYAATLGNAKFVDCSFGEGNGYAYMRPYAPTEFVGCDFEAGFQIDARAAVTFENCTIGGVLLTADNLATLVTSNTANASVK